MGAPPSPSAIVVFLVFVGFTLWLSFWLAARAKSAAGFFAAGGQIHWFVNGVAFAGDYLSAASFLGICGMIAFYGYDGFLYSIGYLAGWVVALFVIAEPLKRLGRYTFADALDSQFQSRGIKLTVAISTLAVSIFYLIPQMVGAGALVKPLLGLPHWAGVGLVGTVVILIVSTAGMVSTTYVQFLKGGLLVLFSTILTGLILQAGLKVPAKTAASSSAGAAVTTLHQFEFPWKLPPSAEGDPAEKTLSLEQWSTLLGFEPVPATGAWKEKPYLRFRNPQSQETHLFRVVKDGRENGQWLLYGTQSVIKQADGGVHVEVTTGNKELGKKLEPVGEIWQLPNEQTATGPLSPVAYLQQLTDSQMVVWNSEVIPEEDGSKRTVYSPAIVPGTDLLRPGNLPAFKGLRGTSQTDKLNFLSLMLALFCGTASLPHILIRYYTVKDQASARLSTVVGIASIGFFYVLTLYIGLGAMVSGALDVSNSNMAAPLLARSLGEWLFACISAIAFTTVLGTVSGLIVAAAGAIVHDLMSGVLGWQLNDAEKIRSAKFASLTVGLIAIALGILFEKMNVAYLVGWAFSIAASANLPSLVMLLFWKRTTREGIIAAVTVGLVSSLGWILLSGDTFKEIYGLPASQSPVPFSQPGIVTIPLGFLALVIVSLLTQPRRNETSAA